LLIEFVKVTMAAYQIMFLNVVSSKCCNLRQS
jgi:hypothetical protein